MLITVGIVLFVVGFLWGRVEEWRRVLDYLHRHEEPEMPVWWLAAGIAADAHWGRKRPTTMTGERRE